MNIDDLRKLAENAHDHIGDICTGKSRWTMTVPTREDDSDILFSKLADGVLALLDRVETAERERDEYRDGTTIVKLTEAERALQRVRELHQPRMNSMSALYPEPLCSCQSLYPCATIRALEDDE